MKEIKYTVKYTTSFKVQHTASAWEVLVNNIIKYTKLFFLRKYDFFVIENKNRPLPTCICFGMLKTGLYSFSVILLPALLLAWEQHNLPSNAYRAAYS